MTASIAIAHVNRRRKMDGIERSERRRGKARGALEDPTVCFDEHEAVEKLEGTRSG